ncbi:MAG: nitroreductase family protein [Promethearchaeota archaeon]
MDSNFEKFGEIVRSRRTVRRFTPDPVPVETLRRLVDLARLSPTGTNRQPLKFLLVHDQDLVAKIFPHTMWGGLVTPKRVPPEGKRPKAWIVLLVDTRVKKAGFEAEMGAAIQTILLGARSVGLGSCWLGSVDRKAVREVAGIPDRFVVGDVVALGYPAESPRVEEADTDDPADAKAVRYYLDDDDVLHVPKRKLEHVLFENEIPGL